MVQFNLLLNDSSYVQESNSQNKYMTFKTIWDNLNAVVSEKRQPYFAYNNFLIQDRKSWTTIL